MDGLEMGNLVRRGSISATELLDEAWRRTEDLNPKLNSIAWPDIELARKAAAEGLGTGPFQGVPMVVKDILATVAGFKATAGCRAFKSNVASEDSELVHRIKTAGFNIFGMSTTPESATSASCEAKIYGEPTRNPWNYARSAGGSSGGAAATVAAGILPIAHGSDGGGSIRIPASACGLFGLKPTRARNPLGPKIGELVGGTAVEHAISRSVRDSAALLDWTQGADQGAPYWAPPVEGNYLAATMRDPGQLRVGIVLDGPLDFPVHEDCKTAVRKTAALCEELGHIVEPATFGPIDFGEMFHTQMLTGAVAAASFMRDVEAYLGRAATEDDLEHTTIDAAHLAKTISSADFMRSVARIHTMGRQMAEVMSRYDVLLTPTLLRPPAVLGEFDTSQPYLTVRDLIARYNGYLILANYSGVPAMSVPLHWNSEGLPIGSHFFGKFGGELSLFALAAQLERAEPWFNKRPPHLNN